MKTIINNMSSSHNTRKQLNKASKEFRKHRKNPVKKQWQSI